MTVRTVLVTGGTGFVGGGILKRLCKDGIYSVTAATRSAGFALPEGVSTVPIANIGAETDWKLALESVSAVIHCAALAHVMQETSGDPLAEYRCVNVEGTLGLARQAAEAGVRRLVYLSSIKVNGERTAPGAPFCVNGSLRGFTPRDDEGKNGARDDGRGLDLPAPEDPYGVSKWEAEQALWEVSERAGLEVVVVRPPLVYGPGAKGNLAHLLKLVRSGVPLPLGAVQNQRSLIGLDNLVDLLIRCVDHPAAAGQTLLASDGEDVSTPDLLRHMAAGLGRSARLLPVPVPLLRLAGRALGKQAEIDRLVGSLQIDSRPTRELLEWTPPVSLAEGIRRMVQGS